MTYIGRNEKGELAFNLNAARGYLQCALEEVKTPTELWWIKSQIDSAVNMACNERDMAIYEEEKEQADEGHSEESDDRS